MHRCWRLGTDHYTAPKLGLQCGVDAGPQPNPAKALFPRTEDDAFAQSTLVSRHGTVSWAAPLPPAKSAGAGRCAQGVTFPGAVIAADSWWNYQADLDVTSAQYKKRLADVNEKLKGAGVDGCPTKCMWSGPALGGCNETARCGVPYVSAA